MIKRIELINFMSHEHTVIEPAAGLTVLVGPNNCGKSAVVTALQIVASNEPSTYVSRHGAKDCIIRVQTEDGHTIEWSRGKNKSPKYVIDGQTHDRLKGGVPDILGSTLRLAKVSRGPNNQAFDIHFGQQKSPVFLVNDPPRAAADFFAASSDAGLLLEMQVLHRQKTRDAKQNLTMLSKDGDAIAAVIESLDPVLKLSDSFESCQKLEMDLHRDDLLIVALERIISRLYREITQSACFAAQATALQEMHPLPIYQSTAELERLRAGIEYETTQEQRIAQYCQAYNQLHEPPVLADTLPLANAIEAIRSETNIQSNANLVLRALGAVEPPPVAQDTQTLIVLVQQIVVQQRELAAQLIQLKQVSHDLQSLTADVDNWLVENPTCPTCGNDTDASNLLCHSLKRGGAGGSGS